WVAPHSSIVRRFPPRCWGVARTGPPPGDSTGWGGNRQTPATWWGSGESTPKRCGFGAWANNGPTPAESTPLWAILGTVAAFVVYSIVAVLAVGPRVTTAIGSPPQAWGTCGGRTTATSSRTVLPHRRGEHVIRARPRP